MKELKIECKDCGSCVSVAATAPHNNEILLKSDLVALAKEMKFSGNIETGDCRCPWCEKNKFNMFIPWDEVAAGIVNISCVGKWS